MSEEFKVEIVNPEKSFLAKDDVLEVVVPAFEGEMGIEKYFVEDGIVEFKNNNLSILTSSIFNIAELEKSQIKDLLKSAEQETNKTEISDQNKYLTDQKIEVLKTLN